MSDQDSERERARRPLGPESEGPSDFVLDRLHLGELEGDELAAAEKAVAESPEAQARLALRREGFGAFEDEVDVDGIVGRLHLALAGDEEERVEPVGFWEKLLSWLKQSWVPRGLAAAAAVGLVVWAVGVPSTHEPGDPEEPGGVRLKGPAINLSVFRERGGQVDEVMSGERFQAGDRLRFMVDLPDNGHVMVVGVEGSGEAYAAFPLGAKASAPAEGGKKKMLRGAVELDGAAGDEWLHLVWCAEPFELGREVKPAADQKIEVPKECGSAGFLLKKGGS